MSLQQIRQALHAHADPIRAEHSKRFFKTGRGQYGEGDTFIGVSVPHARKISRQYYTLPKEELKSLLYSPLHEERLLAMYILVLQFQKGNEKAQDEVYHYYLAHTKQVNNWDLVDSSASYIVGAYLYERDRTILYQLSRSKDLWERRIAIVATHYFIRKKDVKTTVEIAEILLKDSHDLIHKAVGWMLREVGKQDEDALLAFLDRHASYMPRTMLRYSLERLPESVRKNYMKMGKK